MQNNIIIGELAYRNGQGTRDYWNNTYLQDYVDYLRYLAIQDLYDILENKFKVAVPQGTNGEPDALHDEALGVFDGDAGGNRNIDEFQRMMLDYIWSGEGQTVAGQGNMGLMNLPKGSWEAKRRWYGCISQQLLAGL